MKMERKNAFAKSGECGKIQSHINTNYKGNHAYKMRGRYVKAFVIFGILLASTIAYPHSYAESEIMLNLDKRVYVVGESVTISGIVQSPSSNVSVIVQVWNPNNEACGSQQISVGNDDAFIARPVKLSGRVCSIPGTYTISAFYGDQEGKATFEVQAPAAVTQNVNEKLQTLLLILNRAKQNVDNKISDVKGKGIEIPSDVMETYQQALLEVQETEDAVAADDAPNAKEHATNALSAFRHVFAALTLLEDETTDKAAAGSAPEESEDLKKAERVNELRQAISRAIDFKNRLRNIAVTSNATSDVNANFDAFDNAIKEAAKLVEDGKIDEAASALENAHQILNDIQKSLMQKSKDQRLSKAKEFVERTVKRIDEMIQNAKDIGLPSDVIDALENAKAKLLAAKSINEILNVAKEIKGEKNEFTEQKGKNFERAISQLESRLQEAEQKAQQMGMNVDAFDSIHKTIDDARAQWTAGETNNALNILEKAEQALSQIVGKMQRMNNVMNELNRLENAATELKVKVADNQDALDAIDRAVELIKNAKETLTNATSKDDIQSAKTMSDQARQLLEKVRQLVGTKPLPVPSNTGDSEMLKKMVQGLEDRAQRLKGIAEKQENTEATGIIMKAIDIIQKAKKMISDENYDDAKPLLREANELLNKAERMLSTTDAGPTPGMATKDDKAKAMMQEIQVLENVATVLKGKAGDNKEALEHINQAIEDLNDAKGLVKEEHYDQAKSKINDAKEHLTKAKEIIDNSTNSEKKERPKKNSEKEEGPRNKKSG